MDNATENRALYLAWLRRQFPDLYRQAVTINAQGMQGIFDSISDTFNNVVKSVSDALPQLASTYAQYRQQEQLIKENTRRAEQGLPPLILQNGQLTPMTSGAYTQQDFAIASTAGGGLMMNWLLIAAALGLGAILLLRR